jgi:hypothetical protein
MPRFLPVAVLAAVLGLSACAGLDEQEQRVLTGGAIGAATGAVVGAATGGLAVGTGAAIGGAVGAAAGYLLHQTDDGD